MGPPEPPPRVTACPLGDNLLGHAPRDSPAPPRTPRNGDKPARCGAAVTAAVTALVAGSARLRWLWGHRGDTGREEQSPGAVTAGRVPCPHPRTGPGPCRVSVRPPALSHPRGDRNNPGGTRGQCPARGHAGTMSSLGTLRDRVHLGDTRGQCPVLLGDTQGRCRLSSHAPLLPAALYPHLRPRWHLGTIPGVSPRCCAVAPPQRCPQDDPQGSKPHINPKLVCGARPHKTPGTNGGKSPSPARARAGAKRRREANSRCWQLFAAVCSCLQPAEPGPAEGSELGEAPRICFYPFSPHFPRRDSAHTGTGRDGRRLAGIGSAPCRAPHPALRGTKGVLGMAAAQGVPQECPRPPFPAPLCFPGHLLQGGWKKSPQLIKVSPKCPGAAGWCPQGCLGTIFDLWEEQGGRPGVNSLLG